MWVSVTKSSVISKFVPPDAPSVINPFVSTAKGLVPIQEKSCNNILVPLSPIYESDTVRFAPPVVVIEASPWLIRLPNDDIQFIAYIL